MAKYEIMLLVNGELDEASAQESVKNLVTIIEKTEKFKFTNWGLRDLAYKINHLSKGWYFIYNFECDDPKIIAEFRRLTLINKAVIRNLIINLDKDYGARSLANEKKVKSSKIKLDKFNERIALAKLEKENKEKAQREFIEMKNTTIREK